MAGKESVEQVLASLPPEEQQRVQAILDLSRKKGRSLPPPTGDMIMPAETTVVGPDGFVKKTVTPDAGSVADILERNEKELGYIHITYTVQGVNVGWSSARPTTPLSQFLQVMEKTTGKVRESSDESTGSSVNEGEVTSKNED